MTVVLTNISPRNVTDVILMPQESFGRGGGEMFSDTVGRAACAPRCIRILPVLQISLARHDAGAGGLQ